MIKRLLSVLFISMITTGCIATSGDDSVIERSATERPAWANGDFTAEAPSEAYLVFRREEVYRLELGIKQTQAAAIRKTKDLLLSRAKIEIEEVAEKIGTKTDISAAILTAVSRVSESNYTPNEAAAKNVYWENIRKETSEGPQAYYNIYVLLVSPHSELEAAMFRVAKELAESKNPDAKLTGDTVIKNINNVESPTGAVKE